MGDGKLTIFYNKRTGSIKELCGGEQTMEWFGDEAQDYEQIYDYIVVEYDQFIIDNFVNMKVTDGKVKMIQNEVPDKYL